MKFNKALAYPLGAVLIVAAFWGGMALWQKSRHNRTQTVTPDVGTEPQSHRLVAVQGQDSPPPAVSVGNEAPQKIATAVEPGNDWWGARLRPRQMQVDEDEPAAAGAEVIEARPGSAAAAAGLRKGDVIVGVRRRPLAGVNELQADLAALPPGGQLSLQVLRSGEPLELTVGRSGPNPSGIPAPYAPAGGAPPAAGGGSPQEATGIVVNGRELTPRQVQDLKATYGYVAPPGRYWYDPRSGLFGVIGREAAGFMQPGHDFGPMPANASNGNTGVFINGREINMVEAAYCQKLFGAVYQGRWWLDGRTGNMGAEGNPMPIVNVFAALQQAQRSSQGSYSWHSNATGAYGGSSGGCSYVSIPGSGTVMSGNCD